MSKIGTLLTSLLTGLISAGPHHPAAESPALVVNIMGTGNDCTIRIANRVVPYGRGMSEEIERIVSAWPSRSAVIEMGGDTPYRCVGGTVYALQRAQFRRIDMRVAGHSHVPLRVSERDGACRVNLEDSVYALPAEQERVEAHFRSLAARTIAVELDAGPDDVSFRCLREVLVVAQRTNIRFGFVSEPGP